MADGYGWGVLFVSICEFLHKIYVGSSTEMPYLCVCNDLSKQIVSCSLVNIVRSSAI